MPFDGDIQAAMKAQDRQAIRRIMAYNKERAPPAAAPPAPAPEPESEPELPYGGDLQVRRGAPCRRWLLRPPLPPALVFPGPPWHSGRRATVLAGLPVVLASTPSWPHEPTCEVKGPRSPLGGGSSLSLTLPLLACCRVRSGACLRTQAAMKAQDRPAIRLIMQRQGPAKAAAPTDGEGPLPYDGNLQDAMKAQDRPAIRRIMAFNQKQASAAKGGAGAGAAAAAPEAPSDADGPLPYGGDLQSAMKAQDRAAIRRIMKHNAAGRPASAPAAPAPAAPTPAAAEAGEAPPPDGLGDSDPLLNKHFGSYGGEVEVGDGPSAAMPVLSSAAFVEARAVATGAGLEM